MKAAKRFYKDVTTAKVDGGYSVLLDGRTLKTPGNLALIAPSQNIAEFIASEWDAQKDKIRPETMPVTRLVNVSIELTPDNRDKLAEEAKKYAGTDLLCYRAADPTGLTHRQNTLWDPVLEWAREKDIRLETTQSVIAIEQDPESLDKVAQYAASHNNLNLTLFVHLIAVFGSAILAKAVMEKHISGQEAFNLSRLDNLYQIEHWGEDEEAAETAANLETEVIALCKILE